MKLVNGRLSLSSEIMSYATLLLQCNSKRGTISVGVSPNKPIKNMFPSPLENVVLGNLKFIFQLVHQVDISVNCKVDC